MLTHYLVLQFKLLNRNFRDFGLHPLLAYMLIFGAIAGLGALGFQRQPEYAPYIIIGLCALLQMRLSQKQRSDFLNIVYGDKTKRLIRIVENLIISTPFVVLLLFENQYIAAMMLPVVSAIMALIDFNSRSFVMPTPFSKHPYEFAVGFRKTFLFIILVYGLTVISVCVNNLNLGLCSVFALGVVCAMYYGKVENEYYVWIFAESPNKYLTHKILTAIKNTFLMALPMMALLTAFFPENWWIVLLLTAIGMIIVITFLLAAYSTYPSEIGLMEMFLIGLTLVPPFVSVVIPYFYVRSLNRLKNTLI